MTQVKTKIFGEFKTKDLEVPTELYAKSLDMAKHLNALTGLGFAENMQTLLIHMLVHKKKWNLVKVYKAFEFNHSIRCQKPIEYFGAKECSVSLLTKVLNQFEIYENLKPKKTVSETVEPTQDEKDRIANNAIKAAFKHHKSGKHYFVYKHYKLLVERFKMPDNYIGYTDEAKEVLLQRKLAEKLRAEQEGNRSAIKSIGEEIKNWQPSTTSVENIAKELAVKAYFNQLIKENKEL